MGEDLKHECGVAAVSFQDKKQNVVPSLYKLLINMQNRGQLSSGITTYNESRPHILKTFKDIGLVNEVFRVSRPEKFNNIIRDFAGNQGIGHVRYATCGDNDRMYAQPFDRQHGRKYKWFSMCFNGNIANYVDLKNELLQKKGYHLILDSDTEVIMHNISRLLKGESKPDYVNVFQTLGKKFDGAYNIAMVNALGEIVVNRDPLGFRPLVYGKVDDDLFIASESGALTNVGVSKFKDLNPGELLIAHNGDYEIKKYATSEKKAKCFFEWIYFANVSSVIDGKSVYLTRRNSGIALAKQETQKMTKDHIVVPVPDTSKPAAESLAYELGVPLMEGLIRNRYVGRTFIEGKSRGLHIKNKFTFLKDILKDKKVILVDDSIVRGTTIKHIIEHIKEEAGAKEVHLRITCPPVMGPCFYGIDLSTKSELLAPHYSKALCGELDEKTCQTIANDVGADSLIFISHKRLVESIGLPKNELCMACLNCKYPTKKGQEFYELDHNNFINGKKSDGRTISCNKS